MLTKCCALFLALVVSAEAGGSALAHPQVAQKTAAADYFPLKVGSQWDYRVTADGEISQMSMVSGKIERIDGLDLTLVNTIQDGNIIFAEHMVCNKDGVFRHRIDGEAQAQPICVLKGQAQVGDSWQNSDTEDGVEFIIKAKVIALEEVAVPAGKFKALRVEYEVLVEEETVVTMTLWFVANVGMVKQVVDLGGAEFVIELERYQPVR
jgi:hypothetical protein